MCFFPDSVHVGKELKCSICNWFVILNGERGCLSIMQTLRDDSNPAVRKKLRKVLKAENMQSKDRMAVEPIIRLSNPGVPDTLKEVKGGFYLKAVFTPPKIGLTEICRSRFKQYKNPTLISQINVLGCFVNFLAIFRYIWEEIVFLKRVVKFGEIRNS